MSLPSFRPTLENIKIRLDAGEPISALIAEMYDLAQSVKDDGIFVAFLDRSRVVSAAEDVEQRLRNGEDLPLAGVAFTVKDNLDVAGVPTTSNCPGYGVTPETSAPAILAAERAGAVLIAKTTMDQFATGLNGTRVSGARCRNALNPEYIPGGSSSGSGVAVARGIGTFSLGSDTGGSGRVPAAANGVVGLKPTLGLVSSAGMVYCNRSFDCVPIFSANSDDGFRILECIAGYDPRDAYSRPDADEISLKPVDVAGARLAVPQKSDLKFFGDPIGAEKFSENLSVLEDLGFELQEVDFAPFREAGDMVFQSAMVAERLIDYGPFIEKNPQSVVPAVRQAIEAGKSFSAQDLYKTLHRLEQLKRDVRHTLSGFHALVVPTVPRLFTIEEMLADPMALNTIMGTYTYFANPLDLCAVALPGRKRDDGLISSVCFVARDGEDGVIRGLANAFEKRVSA